MKTKAPVRAMRRFFVPVLCSAALLAAPAAYAQISKCVDRSGKVLAYGTECPAGTRAEATNIRNSPSSLAPASAGSVAEREAEFRKRQMEKQDAQAKAEKRASETEARARACDSARSYLKTLQSGIRIARTDPNTGERVYLSDADHSTETTAAQRAVETNCK